MKKMIIMAMATVFFLVLLVYGLVSIQSNSIRTPFYYYPDGFVLHEHRSSAGLTGKYIDPNEMLRVKRLFAEKNVPSQRISYFSSPGHKLDQREVTFVFLEKEDIVLDFAADIIISFLFVATGVLLYYYVRDIYLFLLFISVSLFIIFNFFVLAFHVYYFYYFFILYFIGFIVFNLSFRFQGKEISLKWFFPQIALSFLIGYIGYEEKQSALTFYKIKNLAFIFVFLATLILVTVLLVQIYRERKSKLLVVKKITLIASMSSIVIIPFLLLRYNWTGMFVTRIYFIVSWSLFPFLFIYGTYRYTIVPIQFLFNRSLAIVYQIAFYMILYTSLKLMMDYFVPGGHLLHVLNVVFIFTAVYFLDPVQHLVFDLVRYWTFKRNKVLRVALDEISSRISAPISFKATIVSILRSITNILKVNRILILIAGDQFPRMDPKNKYVMKIPSNSEIWSYLTSSEEIIITSHLVYGSGIRESVYNFLKETEVQLAYPMLGFEKDYKTAAVFLVGEKKDGSNFTLGELTFIKECTRIAELLLYNYSLLVGEVEKKKLIRDLNYASILDRTLNVYAAINNINIGFLSLPAVGISGDYLDIIPLEEKRILIFLGDVVGHGLGSGYLASAIRGLIRDQIRSSQDLQEIFTTINNFFKDRYAGNEFMSLIGVIYNEDNGRLEYINAGHLPLLIQREDATFYRLDKTQPLLGISQAHYRTQEAFLLSGDRLFFHSDGITEAFNERDKMYGMDRFLDFLSRNHEMDPIHLAREIEKEIETFRGDREQSDDISFICLQGNHQESPLP